MLEVLWEKLAAGGWLMLPILAVSVAAWYLILARFFSLRAVIAANRKAVRLLAARGAPPGLPAGSAAARFRERTGAGAASPRILEEELLAD